MDTQAEVRVEAFRPGEMVWLRSGSQAMTVTDASPYTGTVWCRWLNKDYTISEQSFPAAALTHECRRPERQPY
jgi:uncharacterized protein YodC (DUF2158 family)